MMAQENLSTLFNNLIRDEDWKCLYYHETYVKPSSNVSAKTTLKEYSFYFFRRRNQYKLISQRFIAIYLVQS